MKQNTTDRMHEYCCIKYPVYQAWHEHPFSDHTHWFMLVVFSLGIALGLVFQWQLLPTRLARAASYSFAQTSWATADATANTATHASDRSNTWTQWSAKDSQITAAATLTLAESSTSFTENFSSTTYKDTSNTTADWDTTNTRVQLPKTYFGTATTVSLSPAGASAALKAVYVSSGYAYIAVSNTTTTDLMIVDLNNTSNVYTIDFGISGGAQDVEVSGNYAYVTTGTARSLKIVDISTKSSLSVVATVSLTDDAYGIDVSGNYAYIANDGNGLAVVDIGNVNSPTSPGSPVYKSTTNTGNAKSVLVSGSTAFVAIESSAYLEVFDVTTPTSPTNTSSEAYTGQVRGQMAYGSNTIYLAAGSVAAIDVSTLSNPGTPATTSVDDITRGMFVSGSYLYVADDDDSVDIYSISSPTSPVLVAEGMSNADDVFVTGGSVYVVGSSGNELRFSTTDPVNYTTPKVAQSLTIDSISQAITKATLTATATLNSQTISYQLSRDGGSSWENVSSGVEYTFTSANAEKSDLRWKASLSTADTTATPILTNVAITYKYYPSSHVLTSNIFNSQAATTQLTQIEWAETVSAATNVKFQIRTSSDGSTWADWLGPTSTSDYYETTYSGETVNATQSAGANDQYFQYRVYLTSDGTATPTLSDLTISYTITPAIPTLTSSTHSSSSTYYQSYTPTITITDGTGPGPDHYHYLVNQTASPSISAVAAGTSTTDKTLIVSGASVTSDGTWYMHVVAQDSGHANSTSFTTFTFKVDATAPSPTLNFGSITSSSISVSAAGTTDATAGLHATPYSFDRDNGTTSSGYVLGDWSDTGLSVNTQYTYKLKARDATSTPNESAWTSTQSKYTAANTPGTPSIVTSAATSLTVKVTVNSNPSNTEFAIQETNSGNYVQTNGTLGASAAWQTYTNWGGDSGKAVTSLTPSTSYAFKVKAKNGDGLETAFGSSTSGFTGEGVPQNFRASTIETTSILVSVDPIASVDYYFSTTGGQSSGARSTNSWTVGSLTPNTSYTFNAWTRTNGQDSQQVSISVATLAQAPGAVTFTASAATQSSLTIVLPSTGSDQNPSGTEYALYESSQNKYVQSNATLGSSEAWRTLSAWGSSVALTGLSGDTSHTFKLKARNSALTETSFGTSASASTLSASTPRAPNLSAVSTTTMTIAVNNTGMDAAYEFAILENNTSKYVQSDGRLATSAVWKTYTQWGGASGIGLIELTGSTNYSFKVKSRSNNVESSFGPVASAGTVTSGGGGLGDTVPPTRPSDLLYLQLADGIKFTWTDPVESDFMRVLLYRAFENAAVTGDPLVTVSKGQQQFLDTGVLPTKKYSYLVRFEDTSGNGVFSSLIVVTIPARAVVSELPTSSELTLTQQTATTTTTTQTAPSTSVSQPSSTTVLPALPILERPAARDPGTNVKQLFRSLTQSEPLVAPTAQSAGEIASTAPVTSAPSSACADGALLCTVNQFFRVEGVSESLRFLREALTPSRSKREELRTTLVTNDPNIRIIAIFGTLYDLLPQGYGEGDMFEPSVTMSIRYNVRDARTVVSSTQRLTLGYFDATTHAWDILGEATQDAVRGTFTATVSKAGTYGVILVE